MKPFCFKSWKMDRAAALRITVHALEMRMHRGIEPRPHVPKHGKMILGNNETKEKR